MKKIIVFLLILLTSQVSFSTDTSAVKYLPLAVGNKWVFYHYKGEPFPFSGYVTGKITKDTTINSKKYYLFTGVGFLTGWIRLDTTTGNLFNRQGNASCIHPYETLLDSLASKMTDTFYHCTKITDDERKCVDTTNFTMSDVQYKAKYFNDIGQLAQSFRRYGKNIGFVGTVTGEIFPVYYDLRGCVINGVLFGDTTIPLGLQPISTNIPEKFSLYQNYPNPFNPSTKIKFDVPADGKWQKADVKLIIYNILGKEITTLVNQQLQPGTYEVEWDGSNYPSGVYFYKLTVRQGGSSTGEFTETKRMVMIK